METKIKQLKEKINAIYDAARKEVDEKYVEINRINRNADKIVREIYSEISFYHSEMSKW